VRSPLAAAAVRHFENFFKSFANVLSLSPVVPLESPAFALGEFEDLKSPTPGCTIEFEFVVVLSTAFFTACAEPAKPPIAISDDVIAMAKRASTVMLENIIPLMMTMLWL
jgi:hypothetical protein